MTKRPYNPLDKISLARSIEIEILGSDVEPLAEVQGIDGAGVYAIYYRGDFSAYEALARANADGWKRPIYVGKAIPKGGRKGGVSLKTLASGTALQGRLKKHAESIRATQNLKINDFSFRHIVLDDIWIPLGENILIESFKPLWNVAIEGFGINDPGKGRINQKQSAWDVLHPGRSYAARLVGGGPELGVVLGRVEDFFLDRPLRKLPRTLATGSEEDDDGAVDN